MSQQTMSQFETNTTEKISVEFEHFVSELKTLKLRGEEAIHNSVKLIHEYQKQFGNSEKALKRLADAVGVTTRTFYNWIRQVTKPQKAKEKKEKKEKKQTLIVAFRQAEKVLTKTCLENLDDYKRLIELRKQLWACHDQINKIIHESNMASADALWIYDKYVRTSATMEFHYKTEQGIRNQASAKDIFSEFKKIMLANGWRWKTNYTFCKPQATTATAASKETAA